MLNRVCVGPCLFELVLSFSLANSSVGILGLTVAVFGFGGGASTLFSMLAVAIPFPSMLFKWPLFSVSSLTLFCSDLSHIHAAQGLLVLGLSSGVGFRGHMGLPNMSQSRARQASYCPYYHLFISSPSPSLSCVDVVMTRSHIVCGTYTVCGMYTVHHAFELCLCV